MLLGATVTPAWAVGGTSVAIVDSSTRVQVEGKILVLAGGDGVSTAVAATPLSDEVRLVTAAGTSVVLTGALTDDVTTGSSFTGTVSIPADAAGDVNAVVEKSLSDVDALPTASTTVDGESEVGQEILAASATLEAPLTVVEATITASADTVQTATAHKLDVAVVTLPTNPAASVMSNTAISTMTVTLSTYWASQSAGQVASISKPAAVQRFVSPNACDPNTVWDEAAAKFGHSANWYWGVAAARHLVVIAPESCGRGIGLGSVGSLAAGGLIWAGYLGIVATSTIAHEFGHNVGLNHSNVQPCSSPALTAASTDPCADQEYEDAYDIMGASFTYRDLSGVERSNRQLMALNVTQKSVLGALNASDLPTVGLPEGVSVSDSAFTLLPASAASWSAWDQGNRPPHRRRVFRRIPIRNRDGCRLDLCLDGGPAVRPWRSRPAVTGQWFVGGPDDAECGDWDRASAVPEGRAVVRRAGPQREDHGHGRGHDRGGHHSLG